MLVNREVPMRRKECSQEEPGSMSFMISADFAPTATPCTYLGVQL